MIGTVIIAAIVALLVSSLGTLIALKIQHRYLQRTHIQHKAWQQAQEGALRNWEVNQEKRTLGIETKLATRVQQLEKDWQTWEKKDASRVEALTKQYTESFTAQQIERELARLPLVEETPLAFNRNGQHLPEFANWQPPALARADLSERDFSHRYLGQADLREAQLRGASFFMSNLSGACLIGANLTGADLTGANLSNADLRNSVLTNANLQVADLSHTILLGANLHSARNLTTQQVYTAIYDHTTQLDADIDLTMPHMPRIRRTILKPMSNEQAPVAEPATPTNTALESAEVPVSDEVAEIDVVAPMPAAESDAPVEVLQVPAEVLETPEVPATETRALTETPVLPEELVTNEIKHSTNGSNGKGNGTNGKCPEQESAGENADAMLLPLDLSKLMEDESMSEDAVTAEAADIPLLTPLIFPRAIESIEEEDTTVLPAFKKQSTGERATWPASQPQAAEDAPEPDLSSPRALDGSPEDEKAARRRADTTKSKPPLPIDISTQKGKYNGNGRKRARAR